MALHLPTFFTRLGSAVVFAIIMMAGLLWNEWSFLALVALIQVLCLRDYFRLMGKINGTGNSGLGIWTQVGGLLLIAGLAFTLFFPADSYDQVSGAQNAVVGAADSAIIQPSWSQHNVLVWPLFLFFPVLLLLIGLVSERRPWQEGFYAAAGLLYVVLPCLLLLQLYHFYQFLPLVLILCIWMNDTMAYLVGSFIGKTPFSKISPKKTWEGTAGGAVLTIAGAAIAAWLIPDQSMAAYIGIALCAAVAGTAGDLLESKLKRLAGVKDSGTMMPGHGGALDRFDSLLVATPFAFAWIYLLNLL